jgi:hypothetical protein
MKTSFTRNLTIKVLIVCSTTFLLSKKGWAQGVDLCTSVSTSLTVGTSCTAAGGNMKGMKPTAGVPGSCADPNSADIWYKFTATNPWPTITISNLGASLKAAKPVLQLLSGTCGSLTSLACVTGSTSATSLTLPVGGTVGGNGLTVGQVYYVRVATATSTGNISVTASGWTFTLCVTNPSNPSVDNGKSYVNITKGTTGGTVEPGDILEIRATFVVKSNATFQTVFTDNIPAGTTYIDSTLRILTNEGKIYQQFTDAGGDDAGTISGSAITINMGAAATSTTGGYVSNTSKPNFYGSTCIMVASFRVKINAAITYGSQINVGLGSINYNTGNAAAAINFPQYTIMVFNNYGLCSNSVGTNALINESGGTFGSGSVKDRGASNKVPSNYTYAAFTSSGSMPQDYYYGVSNNTSGGATVATGYATSDAAWPIPDGTASPANHRIFGVWDIIGDHTGASNPALGNPPTDDLNGATGGYMVVVNAAYRTDTAYLDTVYNLCPNTYYQYTAWFRNICSRCGCDSNGTGAGGGSTYIPTASGDSSGVYPNLTFNINGYDYYSTGNLKHTGQWVQKGFTYLTGPTQTTMVISIRNNAPGGGGNDWAIDDVGVSSCVPSMTLTPNRPDTLCQGADDTVRFKVTAFFNNYTQWKLEKSINNGVTWTTAGVDTTGQAASGAGTPVYNSSSSLYEYLVARYYRLNLVDTLIKYRITVASTNGNLSDPNCSFITLSPKLVKAINCMIVLPTRLISFKGQVNNAHGVLQWTSASEVDGISFTVESSNDGLNFTTIGAIHGQAPAGSGSTYQFTDPNGLSGARYYRIRLSTGSYSQYSSQVLLTDGTIVFDVRNLGNPFTDHINMEIASPADMQARLNLVDMYGRVVRVQQQFINQGVNIIAIDGLGNLSNGTYILQIIAGDKIITRKMAKLSK